MSGKCSPHYTLYSVAMGMDFDRLYCCSYFVHVWLSASAMARLVKDCMYGRFDEALGLRANLRGSQKVHGAQAGGVAALLVLH